MGPVCIRNEHVFACIFCSQTCMGVRFSVHVGVGGGESGGARGWRNGGDTGGWRMRGGARGWRVRGGGLEAGE